MDLQQALARKGRVPFILSGLPMVEDLCAFQQALARCLALDEDPHLRQWYTVLDQTLPLYQPAFDEVQQALDWAQGIHEALDAPWPTPEEPGAGGDAVARQLAHYLGQWAHRPDLSPWQTQFRDDVWALSELREPLLRRGAWTIFRIQADSATELKERLAQVSWPDYAVERARYEQRQEQFRRRYRWRHQRDMVLQ